MKPRQLPTISFDDPRRFQTLALLAGMPPEKFARRIAEKATAALCFTPESFHIGRPMNQGHTDAVVAEIHADDFAYILKIRSGKTLSAEARNVKAACHGISVELARFLLPPVHACTLVKKEGLPGGVMEIALYNHGRAIGGMYSGLASWREILVHSPRLLPEAAAALSRVWRTQTSRSTVSRAPLGASPVYRDKMEKLARASAPPAQPGGPRIPLDRYLAEGPAAAFLPEWVRSDASRQAMLARVLAADGDGNPLAPTARGFMHGDLHGDNILLHFADDNASGFSVIDMETARSDGCALYDWAKLTLDLVETQYSTAVFLDMPSMDIARRSREWCEELARNLCGKPASNGRWRPVEQAALAAAEHLRNGLTPASADGIDLARALFLNAFFGLRYVSYRNCAWDDPAMVRNAVLYAAAADAFAGAALGKRPAAKQHAPAVLSDYFNSPPDRAFRRDRLSKKRAKRLPGGAVGAYLKATSTDPEKPMSREERAALAKKASVKAEKDGDPFLRDCCLLAWADLDRSNPIEDRDAVFSGIIDRPQRSSGTAVSKVKHGILRGIAHHYRGVLRATCSTPDLDAALSDMTIAARLLGGTPVFPETARAMNSLGHYSIFRHDFAMAGQYLHEAWFLREPFDSPHESAVTVGCLATHARRSGDYAGALGFYETDLSLCDPYSKDAVEQKTMETRLLLLARHFRSGRMHDPLLFEAALSPLRKDIGKAAHSGPFWLKSRLMAETIRLEAGLAIDRHAQKAASMARKELRASMKTRGLDYPSSHVARWLARLESAMGTGEGCELFHAVAAYWEGKNNTSEQLSSRLDASGIAGDTRMQKEWRTLMDALLSFRRDLDAPPELAWRLDSALSRLAKSLTVENPVQRRNAVREVQAFLEY